MMSQYLVQLPFCLITIFRQHSIDPTVLLIVDTFTKLQLVPLFNLFLQNLLFKLLTNVEASRKCSLLVSNQVICGQYREQTPESISHPSDSQASFATTMFDVGPHFARRNGYQKKHYILQKSLMSTLQIQVNMVQVFSLLDLFAIYQKSFVEFLHHLKITHLDDPYWFSSH